MGNSHVKDSMACALGLPDSCDEAGVILDTCKEDSGGPLA